MRSRLVLIAALVAWPCLQPARGHEPGTAFPLRAFYAAQNLMVEKNADDLIGLIQRAGASGYHALVLADYKFALLGRMPPHYFKNVARVQQAARAAGVEIIPAIFPIGYSNGMLAHDPNLAEGLPVVAAPFVVQGREANLKAEPAPLCRNGDLEALRGDNVFAGFSFQDDPGASTFADHEVVHHGRSSCRMTRTGTSKAGNFRLIQRVAVRPQSAYRLSCWVKTNGVAPVDTFHLTVIGAGGRSLTFHEGGIEGTQDWKQVAVVFNSLDQTEVNLYVGLWGMKAGTLWVDEIALEPIGLANVLRRDGCPFAVTSDDGKTTYVEGRDFEPVHDPKLGTVPYAGEFDLQHDGPPIRLTATSRIKDGDSLRVSWYHPVLVHSEQITCCLSEPKVYEWLADQARRVNDLLAPQTFFMSHDELRVANWCRACQDRHLTPGALLADNARRCVAILKQVNPRAKVAVWSDMFDPHHNAVKAYYLVYGSLEGSWEGLAPEVLIANWNDGKARASLTFFAERGHPQMIAGYYDSDDLAGFRRWEEAARGIPKVNGFMYTTWQHKYRLLEEYGKALRGRP